MWLMDSSGLSERGENSAFDENQFCGSSQRSRTNERTKQPAFIAFKDCLLEFLLPPKPNLMLRNQTLRHEYPSNRAVQGYTFFITEWEVFCPHRHHPSYLFSANIGISWLVFSACSVAGIHWCLGAYQHRSRVDHIGLLFGFCGGCAIIGVLNEPRWPNAKLFVWGFINCNCWAWLCLVGRRALGGCFISGFVGCGLG